MNYFKTSITFTHPLEIYFTNINNYMKHPIYNSEYENKICDFGHDMSKIASIYLIFRYILLKILKNNNIDHDLIFLINKIIVIISIVLSLLNMNAFIYLLPVFIIEIYLLKNNLLK